MNDLQQRIADLPPEKRALLEQRLRELTEADTMGVSIPIRAAHEPAPLSFSQERLWFLAQLYPGQTNYNEASAYRLRGPLDVPALQAALDGVVARHEVLRTTYHSQDAGPVQVVEAPRPVSLSIVDLSSVTEGERIAAAQQRFAEVIEEPFDLARDLMVRTCLYRLGDDDHILLAVRHHIASDAWSSRRFWSEIGELYTAETVGRPALLPSLPIQYADYAVWQREWLRGDRLDRQLTYWRERLAGLPPLQLPTDKRRPETLSFHGAGERFELDLALVEKLQALARGEATTLHTLLMTAYAVLLARMAAQDDIAVGVPVAGRVRAELEPLIGFFINTLVIRTRLDGNPPFRELLRQTQQSMLAALDHQDVPFEKLVEALEPERHLNRSPFITTTFQVRSEPAVRPDVPHLKANAVEVPNLHAKFDMECSLVGGPDGVSGHWRYATDLFEASTVRRMIERFQVLLAAIVEDPDCVIGQLPLLTVAERRQILTEWTAGTTGPHPPSALVHELFEAQVRRTPDAQAVVAEEQRLTYQELNERANQVAHGLQELGVGPGTTVGLYLDRTLEMMVGLLGVLKAGGAFVPLDPAAPPARLQMLAEDSGLRVVLTTTLLLPGWPDMGIAVKCLDTGVWTEYQASPDPECPAREESAAYILYTSGSTGKPKGVVVEHRQLMSYVLATVAQYGMVEGGVFAMVQPLTVDSCHTMIFPALGWGGTLHLVGRELALDARAMGDYCEIHQPDYLKIAPSHLQALMAATDSTRLLPRRCLIVGGEAFHWDLAERLLALKPGCAIWNHYGPTETTVGVLTYPVTEANVAPHRGVAASVPLGRPLPGVRVYILDSLGNPVPIGSPGELCIGGPFVTRGYLNRPEQTAAQFREDELADEAGARRYHTGDMARWLADGVVEFLGRGDDQVKIRGVRVELGEIEAALGEHPGVAERCAVLRDDEAGWPVLVAYVSPRPDAGLQVDGLDVFLRARLPEVMVPAAYVVLEALPRTAHGKIDRAALPAPDSTARVASGTFIAPRSPEEETVAAIWREVLRLEQVGVHDSFFELGGHSLLAIQVIARISRFFDVEIPVRILFEKPTVAGLATYVMDQRRTVLGQWRQQGAAIKHVPSRRRAPLSFAQERHWFLSNMKPEGRALNMNRMFRVRGKIDVRALEQSLVALIERHAILRTAIGVEEGTPYQQINPAPESAGLTIIDLSHLPAEMREDQIESAIGEHLWRVFDLSADLMLRTLLVKIADEDHVLVFGIPHVATDHWSWTILLQDFRALYEASARGTSSHLPDLRVQYADYAFWQREWLQGDRLERQLAYWTHQLADLPILELPTDWHRPEMFSGRGGSEPFFLAPEIVKQLRGLARSEKTTLHTVLLAIYAVLLSRNATLDDIAIGTPIAGRTTVELESVAGLFLNTLVIRVRLAGNPSFRTLLRQVRQTTLEAYDHQAMPFEKLVEVLNPARHLNRPPLIATLFQLYDLVEPHLDLSGLTIERLSLSGERVGYDLEFSFLSRQDRISGYLRYATDLFHPVTIRRMIGRYQTLLAAVVADPDCPVSRLPMLAPEEQQALLGFSNALSPASAETGLIHRQFEAQVMRTPDAPAASLPAEDGATGRTVTLSYGELNRRANKLAHALRRWGVGPETAVGLYFDRSLEMIVGILGVLKAGGAYVPLDPANPRERLALIADECRTTIMLTQEALLDTATTLGPTIARVVCLDRDWAEVEAESDENLADLATPESLAYVMFTSGSTGRPKGVMVTHANVVRLFRSTEDWYGYNERDVLTLFHSFAFDISVWELFGALFYGGRIVIVPYMLSRSPDLLYRLLCNEGVTAINQTPAAFRQLMQAEASAGASQELALRYVILGGEALELESLRPWFLRHGDQRPVLINMYGITETTVFDTYRPLSMADLDQSLGSIIGVPFPDMQVYVLDADGQLAPIGVAGEIYLGGPCLARGYINRPELTEQRFVTIAAPTGSQLGSVTEPNVRLYRSGDLGRWLPTGDLEYLGRMDHQLKIRGFRVEPGEIEGAIARHPGVREVVVVARDDQADERQLVAYLVPAGEPSELSPAGMRAFLSKTLPDYMIPAAFVFMPQLPLTTHDKIDRAALPAPNAESRGSDAAYVPPRSPEEEAVAAIWREVLRLEQVGVHDNFFELGGHSLLATQVASRISQTFDIEFPLRALFERPTVAEAAAVATGLADGRDAERARL